MPKDLPFRALDTTISSAGAFCVSQRLMIEVLEMFDIWYSVRPVALPAAQSKLLLFVCASAISLPND